MRLESARDLKRLLLEKVVEPFSSRAALIRTRGAAAITASRVLPDARSVFGVGARPAETLPTTHRSVALGVAPYQQEFRLALRVQRPSLVRSEMVEALTRQAKGEVDVRLVGRIDKRARARRAARAAGKSAAAIPWYQQNTRPLLIGASVGHVKITAGTIGAFVTRGSATYILSNNHVLANEGRGRAGDRVLQRAPFDGGRQADAVARLRFWVELKKSGRNIVDAALAEIDAGVTCDVSRLRQLVKGGDRALAGVGPSFVDEGESVFKLGRTTGATEGRITAFDLDNVVVNYDAGNLRFDNQIEIEGAGTTPFSDGGDSGSMIVNAEMKAIALLFAGSDIGGSNGLGLTYANPMGRVLQDLKATLLF
jgi:hypothetical protein